MAKRAKLRKIERKDARVSKWGISIPQEGARPKRVFFESAAKRDAQFAMLRRTVRAEGHGVLSTSAADVALLKDLREILPDGVDPREAARFYMERNCPDTTVALRDAVRGFLKRQQFRKISQDGLDHQILAMDRLVAFSGKETQVAAIGPDSLMSFVMSMGFKPRTVENHCKIYRTFFNWCVEERFCSDNPMKRVGSIVIPETEPEFMPAGDVQDFFIKTVELRPEVAPALALSFFGGLRSTSVQRIERADIDFEQRGIRFQGMSHKTKRRFFIQGYPENLWDWLEPWRALKELPHWTKSNFIRLRHKIYTEAEVAFPHNAGRHSFCTYHVALHGSADRTATLLTHRGSVSMLYDHYRGNATKAAAEKYFRIVPSSA